MFAGLSMLLLIQALACVVLTWIFYKLFTIVRCLQKFQTAATKFHKLPKHWFWGTIPLIKRLGLENLFSYIIEESKGQKKVLIWWKGFLFPCLFITHPKTAGEIFRSTIVTTKSSGSNSEPYDHILPWLGESLLTADGKVWERKRKLLRPAFHHKDLQSYMRVYNEAVQILLTKIDKLSRTGKSFEISHPMALCTLDVMLRCAFSYDGNVQEMGSRHPYVQAVQRLTRLLIERSWKPHMFINWIYYLTKDGREFKRLCDYVHAFADKIIERRQRQLFDQEVTERPNLDFLDILLAARDENGAGFSKTEVRAEVDTFLFAGHDTTATGASWAMYALAKYPNVQEKVYQEVHEIMGDNETVKWSDLTKLSYTTMFIKEVLRMYPPVPVIGRQLSTPLVIDGVEFPAGISVAVLLNVVHLNPEVWENPEEFRPERFSEDQFSSKEPYSYVPFSAGPRNCIGQTFGFNELRVITSRIVNRFRLVIDTDHPIQIVPEIVLRAKDGIKVKMYQRS